MKKMVRILTHPILLILSFCFLIISGEAMGGFFLIYLLFGLPHGGLHSILGFAGIALLIIALYSSKHNHKSEVLQITGALCFAGSLICFFTQPGASYNYDTFYQTVPLSTIILFTVLLLFFVAVNIHRIIKLRSSPPRDLHGI